jgi:proteasome alpha subunit
MKPMEVEILVAEVGHSESEDQLFHILFDGTVVDEHKFCVLGGDADPISERIAASWTEAMTESQALRAAVAALSGPDRVLAPGDLEVAFLARTNGRRAFKRHTDDEVAALLA